MVKTIESNVYSDQKYIKTLKFYNYRNMNSDAKLMKQIVIEEGLFAPGYKSYDCSVLHFGNFIIFYQREETWHKLQMYNVVTNELEELEGYHIQEPIGEDIRYHIMFSK